MFWVIQLTHKHIQTNSDDYIISSLLGWTTATELQAQIVLAQSFSDALKYTRRCLRFSSRDTSDDAWCRLLGLPWGRKTANACEHCRTRRLARDEPGQLSGAVPALQVFDVRQHLAARYAVDSSAKIDRLRPARGYFRSL